MDDEILVPDFSSSESTIGSLRRKNDNGICWVEDCNNKFIEPAIRYRIGNVCQEHADIFEKMHTEALDQIHKDADEMAYKQLKIWGLI